MDQSICSNLCFGHFWDIGDALLFFFTWVNFSVSFSTINNSDSDTPLVALAKKLARLSASFRLLKKVAYIFHFCLFCTLFQMNSTCLNE